MNLLWVEIRRALRRRVIRVLILIALAWCAFAGVVGYLSSAGKTLAQLHYKDSLHPAVLVDWWQAGKGDSAVTTAALFLLIGGFFAGAAVAGAEWRAGTITTVLTWEPRRARLNLTRTAACGICAFVIAFLLQVIFLASFLPAVLANGSTAGADRSWWISLTLAVARTSVVTSIAAMLAVALATLGRNTAFALGVVFAWVVVIEGLVRGLRPGWAQYLWGENVATTVQWGQLKNVGFSRGPLLALATIAFYTAVFVALATVTFHRRDIAGST
jgi:ABC-type transport system involved in multi-copper enzyme maturation permease subunit